MIASPSLAQDEEDQRESSTYITVFAGKEYGEDFRQAPDGGLTVGGQPRNIDIELDSGKILGGAIGLASRDNKFWRLRGEIEVSYRKSDLQALALNGVDRVINRSSDVSAGAVMINGYLESPKLFNRIRVFAGGGFGATLVDNNIYYLVAVPGAIGTEPNNLQINIGDTEVTSAYQFMAGVDIAITKRLSLTGSVRQFQTGELHSKRFIQNAFIGGVPTTQGVLDSVLEYKYRSTSGLVGLTYRF
jgi:opacity protein-like surface antigen